MQNKRISLVWMAFIIMGVLAFCISPIRAEETESVSELKKQIEALQKRVDQLEAEKKESVYSPRPNYPNRPGWDPFEDMYRMQEEMDQMLQNSPGFPGRKPGGFNGSLGLNSDFDLKETSDGYEFRFDMTGLDKNKMDIQIKENSISIKGERSQQDTQENRNGYFSSQSFGSFMKTIPLPVDADTAKVNTQKEGDTLVIQIPKKTK